MQGLTLEQARESSTKSALPESAPVSTSSGGGGGGGGGSGGGGSSSSSSSSQPKKLTWASIASQPAKPQLTTKKKSMVPPPMVTPRTPSLDIGTWENKNGGGSSQQQQAAMAPPTMTVVPPPIPQPTPIQQVRCKLFENSHVKMNSNDFNQFLASCGATSCCPEANGSRCHRSPTASCLPKRGATTASNGSTKCQSGRNIDPRLPSAEWSASSVGAAAATVYGGRSTAAGASAAELFRGGSGSGTVGCGAKQLAVESRAGRAAVEAHLQSQRI